MSANRKRTGISKDVLDNSEPLRSRGQNVDDGTTGFDVEEYNEIYSVVIVGGRTMILEECWKLPSAKRSPPREPIRFLAIDAFEKWFSNRIFRIGGRQWNAAQLWMRDPRRREYQGLIFDPSLAPGGADEGGYYNLWQGFSVEPDSGGSCAIFLDHIRTNVADGNETHANFILGTFADMLQNPTDRKGIALVFRGKQGCGKTVVGTHIGRLISRNYLLADDPRYITGNFNAHLGSVLFLQADEGFWAGDKQAEGRLKGLITSSQQMIEMKGKDPVSMNNCVHLLVSSNADWVVPAGHEERRFSVFDVADHCLQNHEYFASMQEELDNGGYEALLHYLLNFDTSTIDLRRIPNTAALYEQKIASLPPLEMWWHTCLQRGWIVRRSYEQAETDDASEEDWPAKIEIEHVHSAYVKFCESIGVRHRKTSPQLGVDIRKLVPSIVRQRATVGASRPYVYLFPSLQECRYSFEKMIGTEIDWESGQPLSTPSTDETGA